MSKPIATAPTEHYAYQYCHMAGDFYGRFEIVWQFDHPTLSIDMHEWWNFFSMRKLHQALQVEKAGPQDIIAILTRLGFEDISEHAECVNHTRQPNLNPSLP